MSLVQLATLPLQAATGSGIALPRTFFFGERKLEWRSAIIYPEANGVATVILKTDRGQILGKYHRSGGAQRGVIWVHGAGGGMEGPARAVYSEACDRLQSVGIAGLRLEYRKDENLHECVLDTLCAAAFLASEGITRIAVVGHSFGGGVAVCAAATSPRIDAVVAMSSQTLGALQMAPLLASRPLLLVQGGRDKVLPTANADKIFAAAHQPKELKIFPDAGHGLTQARPQVLELLLHWLPEKLDRRRPQ